MSESNIKDVDPLNKKLFAKPTFFALTIGIPFCTFKFLFGILAIRIATTNNLFPLILFGWFVILWAIIDFIMNSIHIIKNLLNQSSTIQYCLLAQIGCLFKRPSLFLCVDTMISFLIICFVLWSGWIVKLSPFEAYLWYAATTINLVSLAIVNIRTEFLINTDEPKHDTKTGE